MFKSSIEICKINKMMKLKFGLVVRSEEEKKFPNLKVVSKFNYYGNDYFTVRPNPFITIDISSYMTKDGGWSTNNSVSLNRYYLFRFIGRLNKLIRDFKDIKSLFYYDDNILKVDNELAEKITLVCHTSSSKKILMRPCVVPDEDNTSVYEGCIFAINTLENFSYLTYTEMQYLFYELNRIDMSVLSLQLLSMIELNENKEIEYIKTPPTPENMNINKERVSSTFTKIKKSELPKI